jgi:hypothetical protein
MHDALPPSKAPEFALKRNPVAADAKANLVDAMAVCTVSVLAPVKVICHRLVAALINLPSKVPLYTAAAVTALVIGHPFVAAVVAAADACMLEPLPRYPVTTDPPLVES